MMTKACDHKYCPDERCGYAVDWTPFQAASRKMARQVTLAMAQWRTVFTGIERSVKALANDEVNVCGLEARFYVRGGVACRLGLEDLDDLIGHLLNGAGEALFLTRENRIRLAVAAMRGYADSETEPVTPVIWYRYFSAVR